VVGETGRGKQKLVLPNQLSAQEHCLPTQETRQFYTLHTLNPERFPQLGMSLPGLTNTWRHGVLPSWITALSSNEPEVS
jgi:hypothetical protein